MIRCFALMLVFCFSLMPSPVLGGPIVLLNKFESVNGTGGQSIAFDSKSITASGAAVGFGIMDNGQYAEGDSSLQIDFSLKANSHTLLTLMMDADGSPGGANFRLIDENENVLRSFAVGVGNSVMHVDESLPFDLLQGNYRIFASQVDPAISLSQTSFNFAFVATAVPEPSSLLLMLVGIASALHVARSERQRR